MPEQAPDGSIIITPKEFYDGVKNDIAEIKAAVSPLPELHQKVTDQEMRLRKLEQFKWVLVGVAVASGGAASAIAGRLG